MKGIPPYLATQLHSRSSRRISSNFARIRSLSRLQRGDFAIVLGEMVLLLRVTRMEPPAPAGQSEHGRNDERGQHGVEHRSISLRASREFIVLPFPQRTSARLGNECRRLGVETGDDFSNRRPIGLQVSVVPVLVAGTAHQTLAVVCLR